MYLAKIANTVSKIGVIFLNCQFVFIQNLMKDKYGLYIHLHQKMVIATLIGKISRKKIDMTYSLFVDDERNPKTKAPVGEWVVARSYIGATVAVFFEGIPRYISMDHDLGEGKQTGYDFVKWLVDCHMKEQFDFPEFNYHTANPVGRDNMESYVENYLKTIRSQPCHTQT